MYEWGWSRTFGIFGTWKSRQKQGLDRKEDMLAAKTSNQAFPVSIGFWVRPGSLRHGGTFG